MDLENAETFTFSRLQIMPTKRSVTECGTERNCMVSMGIGGDHQRMEVERVGGIILREDIS